MYEHNKVTVTKPDGTVVLDLTTDNMLVLYTGGDSPEGQQGNFMNGKNAEVYSLALSFVLHYEQENPEMILLRAESGMKPPFEAMGEALQKMLGGAGKENK